MIGLSRRVLFLAPFLSLPTLRTAEAGEEVDGGADSVYLGPTVRIGWAVLRGSAANATNVVLRIVNSRAAYRFVRLDGGNPFTGRQMVLVPAAALANSIDLVVARTRFESFPHAEVRLYKNQQSLAADRPNLTVSYVGVPDTTPEFTSESAMSAYLRQVLAGSRPGG